MTMVLLAVSHVHPTLHPDDDHLSCGRFHPPGDGQLPALLPRRGRARARPAALPDRHRTQIKFTANVGDPNGPSQVNIQLSGVGLYSTLTLTVTPASAGTCPTRRTSRPTRERR